MGAKAPRDLFDTLEGMKLSWMVVVSSQCRIGVHVHDLVAWHCSWLGENGSWR